MQVDSVPNVFPLDASITRNVLGDGVRQHAVVERADGRREAAPAPFLDDGKADVLLGRLLPVERALHKRRESE